MLIQLSFILGVFKSNFFFLSKLLIFVPIVSCFGFPEKNKSTWLELWFFFLGTLNIWLVMCIIFVLFPATISWVPEWKSASSLCKKKSIWGRISRSLFLTAVHLRWDLIWAAINLNIFCEDYRYQDATRLELMFCFPQRKIREGRRGENWEFWVLKAGLTRRVCFLFLLTGPMSCCFESRWASQGRGTIMTPRIWCGISPKNAQPGHWGNEWLLTIVSL